MVNAVGFLWMFPAFFLSSALADPSAFPEAFRRAAEANPLTAAADAARALLNGRDPGTSLPLAVGWAVGLNALFGWLAAARFVRLRL